jgi:oligoendopeptidase F
MPQYAWSWSLDAYFPSIESPAYEAAWKLIESETNALDAQALELAALTPANAVHWARWMKAHESLSSELSHMGSYLGCVSAVDSRNETYKRELARMSGFTPRLEKLRTALLAKVGAAPEPALEALLREDGAKDLAFPLRRLREEAKWRMPDDLEDLNSELGVNGPSAWNRLYGTVCGKLSFELAVPGRPPERRSLAEKRSLLEHPEASVRKAALQGSNAAVTEIEDVFAAALNAIVGWRLTSNRRRGERDSLAPANRMHHVERETVEAMFGAIRDRIEVPRSFLRAKAKALGLPKLGFQDIEAPYPSSVSSQYSWDEACAFVLKAFKARYPALHDFSKMALEKKWIDAEPRAGRRPGGFCSTSAKIGESRIFMTYGGSLGDMQTLAHELGHAFHGALLKEQRPMLRRYPSTLAETASTFAQVIVSQELSRDASLPKQARKQMLVTLLNDNATFCLDIFMRYEFEKKLMEERKRGEVSVSRLKEMMSQTQQEIFGDVLDPSSLDPYFWATKLHFYGYSFYNYPYSFGYLLSRVFTKRLAEEGEAFLPVYEKFLRDSGSQSCEEVVLGALGQDIRRKEFWAGALDEIERDFSALEALN